MTQPPSSSSWLRPVPPGPPARVNGHTHTPTPQPAPDRAAAEEVDEAEVVRQVRRQVTERLTSRTGNTAGDLSAAGDSGEGVRRLIVEALDDYTSGAMAEGRPPLPPQVEARIGRAVADALLGVGGLQPLLDDERIEDIAANGCDNVHVRHIDGRWARVGAIADSDEEMVDLIRMLAARSGQDERRFDRASPILDLQLSDGARLNAVMAVARRPSLSIRRHRHLDVTLDDLVALGTLSEDLAALLGAAVRARLNIMIAGHPSAGKTTLLRALVAALPAAERLVTIEDSYELGLDNDPGSNVVALQARHANVEGEGAIAMAALFRTALRMAPDRVIVGEVRGPEVVEMLNAMSVGNNGSLSTIHASSSHNVFAKIVTYAQQSALRISEQATRLLVGEALHLVVHLGMAPGHRRIVTSIREVAGSDGTQVASNEIYRTSRDGTPLPAAPLSAATAELLADHGYNPGNPADGLWPDGGHR
jgi:pilus assembly protein CpaF